MKIQLLLVVLLSTFVFGCSVFPFESAIKDNHFKLTNFNDGLRTSEVQQVYLMCWRKRPALWSEPKQYPEGEHDLWVKASINRGGLREAYVNFKVNLKAEKSYQLNRKIDENKISIWIEDIANGEVASEVVVTDLKFPPTVEDTYLKMTRCKAGSV